MASNPRIDDLRRRLEREPGSRLFAQLAEELRKAGEVEEAITVSLQGLEKHSNYPSARMTLGRCLQDKGDLAGARREFESVFKAAPDNILAGRFLAECLEGLGDVPAAVAQYKAVLRISPSDSVLAQRLAALEARPAAPIATTPQVSIEPEAPPPPPAAATPEAAAELPPIPLASVDDEAFELERPYESPVTSLSGPEGDAPVPGEPEVFEVVGNAPPAPHAAPAEAVFDATPVEPEPVLEPPVPAATPQEPESPSAVAAPSFAPAPPAPEPAAGPSGAHAGEPQAPVAAPLPDPARAPRTFEGEPPPPWVEAPASPGAPPSQEIISSTLAELYFSQGVTEKAIEVYRQVLLREPGNDRARARLAELERLEEHLTSEEKAAPAPPASSDDPRQRRRLAVERTIARLEAMLGALRKE
jgi:tetratricopeptide (TPR) repeat protein